MLPPACMYVSVLRLAIKYVEVDANGADSAGIAAKPDYYLPVYAALLTAVNGVQAIIVELGATERHAHNKRHGVQ